MWRRDGERRRGERHTAPRVRGEDRGREEEEGRGRVGDSLLCRCGESEHFKLSEVLPNSSMSHRLRLCGGACVACACVGEGGREGWGEHLPCQARSYTGSWIDYPSCRLQGYVAEVGRMRGVLGPESFLLFPSFFSSILCSLPLPV